MAKIRKLVEKMLRLPAEMRFDELDQVLKFFDWHVENVQGSHFIYMKSDQILTVVKKRNKVKRGYIREIIEILNLEEWYEQTKK